MKNVEDSCSSNNSSLHEANLSSSNCRVILLQGHNIWEWIFLAVCLPNAFILIASSVLVFAQCVRFDLQNYLFILELIILLLAAISFGCAIYGIFQEHQYDIYLYSSIMLLALLYSWVSYSWIDEKCKLAKLICNCFVSVLWIGALLLSVRATTVPDWSEYNLIGVSNSLTAMYRQLCYFLVVLKFDTILMVSSIVLGLQSMYSESIDQRTKIILLNLLVTYAIISWSCGKIAFGKVYGVLRECEECENEEVHKEDKYLIFGFVFLCVALPGWMIYEFYEISSKTCHWNKSEVEKLYCTALISGIFSFLVRMYLLIQTWKTYKIFGYGLNNHAFNDLVSRNSTSLLAHPRSAITF